jgi:hypothetical protein
MHVGCIHVRFELTRLSCYPSVAIWVAPRTDGVRPLPVNESEHPDALCARAVSRCLQENSHAAFPQSTTRLSVMPVLTVNVLLHGSIGLRLLAVCHMSAPA